MSRLEAQNLDTIQAMQIRMNLQQLFTMDAKTARRFLDRWNAWVQVCDLGPMKRLAKTIMAKAEGILRSIATGLSNGVLEAINGNVKPPSARPKATEPSEISKPSSTSSPGTFWPIHPLEIATSPYWRANFDAHAHGPLNTSRPALKSGIFFRPNEVIRAETIIAKQEFDRPIVGLEQAIGWIAYRNQDNFRSLGKFDLREKKYYGVSYESNYNTMQLEKELFDALVNGDIKGYRDALVAGRGGVYRKEELELTTRMNMRTVDFIDLVFFRKDLVERWPATCVSPTTFDREVAHSQRRERYEPALRNEAAKRMRADIDSGKETTERLSHMSQDALAVTYGVRSRDTAVKALRAVLKEIATSKDGVGRK